ncbi:MAG: ASKHA domain-containing protein, partial [Dehalococcoidia bacterium]
AAYDIGGANTKRLVAETINELLSELGQKLDMDMSNVQEMVVAGNTTMTHLFLGLPPKHIREEPYVPTATHFPRVRAGELGVAINPLAPIYCLPAVAAYVGGDITAGVLSSCLFRADKLSLFLDIGTNGEIVLGNSDWMTTCACSAGPAFEGAGVRHGMRAMKGAIEEVRINSKTLEATLSVIGGGPPQGICGSGMISALAEMFITGVIDRSGRINMEFVKSRMKKRPRARKGDHGGEFVLAWARDSGVGEDIILTEVDINNLIRTKAAIYAGIAVMAQSLGIPLSDVEEVLIGGAFGQHINVEEAIQIGLLPDLPWERFKFLGNTSLWGAYNALLSRFARAQVEEIAGKLTYMELIADNTFMNELTGALFLPHTDINQFPSVKALLEKNEGQKASP